LRRVTIHDVAGKAGVSMAAVSHAFNDPERLLEGIGSVTDERGIGLLTVTPLSGSLERAIAAAPVDGFVIIGLDERNADVAPLRKRGVPFVVVDGDAETASSVNVDDEGGAYAAADFLLKRGHREIVILTFHAPPEELDKDLGVRGRRLRGYRRAFTDHGVALDDANVLRTFVTLEGGDAAFSTAWSEGARPTAVLAVSDIMAIGAIRAAKRLGLRVPEDLEVIGFDDIPLAAASDPSLTTVHQPIPEKGRVATRLLIRELDAGGPRERIVLPTELLLRESTRALTARSKSLGVAKGGGDRGRKRSLTKAAAH
jgi:DNA-binding LacI/PurR family transcriptional regulator